MYKQLFKLSKVFEILFYWYFDLKFILCAAFCQAHKKTAAYKVKS